MKVANRSLSVAYSGNVLERRRKAAAEFLAWADQHAHEQRLSQSSQAQIEHHPDLMLVCEHKLLV